MIGGEIILTSSAILVALGVVATVEAIFGVVRLERVGEVKVRVIEARTDLRLVCPACPPAAAAAALLGVVNGVLDDGDDERREGRAPVGMCEA